MCHAIKFLSNLSLRNTAIEDLCLQESLQACKRRLGNVKHTGKNWKVEHNFFLFFFIFLHFWVNAFEPRIVLIDTIYVNNFLYQHFPFSILSNNVFVCLLTVYLPRPTNSLKWIAWMEKNIFYRLHANSPINLIHRFPT